MDLALAVEWGPIRIFRNQGGRFEETTSTLGLLSRTGWWTGIVAGDFDGDGRMDLAVGNAGRNTGYALFQPSPIRIYFGDWNGTGILGNVEAWRRDNDWLPIKNRTVLGALFPDLATRFPTHEAFSHASVPTLLGIATNTTSHMEATELDSGVLLNRGSHFDWLPFPKEAQMAPVFSVNVADVDGDGIEDVFLSQNRFDLLTEFSRDDAGRGLWMRGTGDGHFKAIDASESGVAISGEQRAAALSDFNQDGRIDLAVTQVLGPTRLLLNLKAKPGILIRLQGPATNPEGTGAQVRLQYADGSHGPTRALQAGSGYSSQDSSTQVMGMAKEAASVRVRWPGGKEQVVPLNQGQMVVRIPQSAAP
jgi:hypothetical protein